jgi:hypothetical protein
MSRKFCIFLNYLEIDSYFHKGRVEIMLIHDPIKLLVPSGNQF